MSKIALVDDDRNILTSVSMTLEAEGFDVETYNDGQSALDAFNRRLPDMAVLDIKMPRMDGMELLQRLRQKTNMPVIFLTSKDDEIDHDVRRLDRLVSDISNASRLDSELVKETQEEFDLLRLVENLTAYLGADAESKGVDFITDLPDAPVLIHGLEARLAQVFVNLITNAISFCEEGDAIRVWIRTRENRVLVVVEDTGPGIPEGALGKVFNRFYSAHISK